MILGEQPFHIRRQPAGPKKKKKKSQVAPAGVLRCSAHLLRSSLPNSHSPLNYDGSSIKTETLKMHMRVRALL